MPKKDVVNDPTRPKPAPPEFAGMYVAWNDEETEIIAHAVSLEELIQQIDAMGQPEAIIERVRRLDEHFVGHL
jgi:hypothetical protein